MRTHAFLHHLPKSTKDATMEPRTRIRPRLSHSNRSSAGGGRLLRLVVETRRTNPRMIDAPLLVVLVACWLTMVPQASPFGIPSSLVRRTFVPPSSYRGYPDQFDDYGTRRRNNNGGRGNNDDEDNNDDDDPMNWWEQAIRRASSSSASSAQGGGGGGMVQPVGVDGEPLEAPNTNRDPSRIRAGFDKLFSGMPTVGEILGGAGGTDDDDENEYDDNGGRDGSSVRPARRSSRLRNARDATDDEGFAWFEDEKEQIVESYRDILDDMMDQLEEERKADPDRVPANAEALVRSVLKEEMEREIVETRERRARERLDSYGAALLAEEATKDVTGPPDASLQKLIDESEDEYARQEASRAELEEFLRYEKEAFQRAAEKSDPVEKPAPGSDLDRWALDRLKEMAKTQEGTDAGLPVLDILEESVKMLQKRLEKQKQKGPIMPDTMKEWQMYRSIATRLFGPSSADPADGREHSDERERRILEQLESWKEYVDKETTVRAKSGLARGPKLPFEWQESSRAWDQRTTVPDTRSRADVRKDINRMSIDALESLAEKSDPSRRENLLREVEFLKSTLEGRDYLDVEEEAMDPQPTAPVDLSDLFMTSSTSQIRDDEDDRSRTVASVEDSADLAAPNTPFFAGKEAARQPPPETPFFTNEDPASRSRPPSTPFFTDSEDFSGAAVGDSKLGSMEEQKLNAMFRRTGVRSKEEQDVIRRQWEDFKRTEEEKRKMSGLSSSDESDDVQSSVTLKYNVSDVMLEGGDFDAEKVLATIGPRPKRSEKPSPTASMPVDSSLDEEVVRDSLYRAVAAIGGGRYKEDPEMKAKQQASFEEFLDKEEEMRRALDDVGESVAEMDSNATFDDKQYAEEVLSSLGPRPKPKRSKIIDEGEFSDKGGVLAAEDDEDDDDTEDQEANEAPGDLWGVMPEWLRKERVQEQKRDPGRSQGRFPGSEIDDVFDDDYYDRNMRQLHEYEQRRTGRQRRMGIDISDVLGSRYETDDYADYKFDDDSFRGRSSSGWGEASFAARKRDLLEYTELELTELNRLMDHKDSVYATGVSQYLPRINKPFKEFGAIFRLEGVLVETTGLQYKAWSKVAKEFNFREPTIDEVRRAAVIRPEAAVREAFYWTDDIIETRKAAVAHRDALRVVFDEWRSAVGIAVAEPSKEEESGALAIGQDIVEQSSPIDSSSGSHQVGAVGSSSSAWAVIAELFGKAAPTEEEGWHAASLSPEEAIVAFGWTDDANSVLEIAEAYREYVRPGSLPSEEPSASASGVSSTKPTHSTAPVVLDEVAVTESHYFAWKKVAERFQFEAPDPETVLAAFVINDPTLVIRDGFGWTEDSSAIKDAAKYFTECLEDILRERLGGNIPSDPVSHLEPRSTNANAKAISVKASEPSEEELLDVQLKAWSTAARAHGFALPTADIAKLTVGVDGQDAVLRLLKWTDDGALASQIASTYQRSYDELMSQLLKKYGIQYKATSAPSPASPTPRSGPTDDDIFRLAVDAWSAVASKNGYPAPDNDEVMFAMTVGPEEAILTGFQWTDDREEAKSILEQYKTEIGVRRQQWSGGQTSSESANSNTPDETLPPVTVSPDVSKWVKSLLDVEMQCAVVSFLERDQLDVLLEYAGLSDLFPRDRRVSATNGYSRESQQMLGAALRLERRPDLCVMFDSSPQASDAAHENMMQSVNIIGPFPRYELLSADSTAASFTELTAMNIRRLFGERVYDQPQLETMAAAPAIKKQPKIQTRFWDDDS